MIKKYTHKINSLFYPFGKTFEIVVIGEDKNICGQFVEMCKNHITNRELLQYGLECTYNRTNNEYEIKTDKQDFVKFKFSPQELPNGDWDKANITGDVFVPIFKYQPFKYNRLPQNIEGFLGKIQQCKKTTITVLVNFDSLYHKPIADVKQWEDTINKIYETLQQDKKILNNLNNKEQQYVELIYKKFQQHLKRNSKYTAYNICNFFCYNEASGFSYGKEEFFTNLLMRLLSFDKLNNYKYRIKI
jgi:hypothetical protein